MLSDIIAIIALILSMISLYWQWSEKRPRLKVNPSIVTKQLPITSNGQGGFILTETPTLTVYLANTSEKPIQVKGVYLRLPKGKAVQLDEFHALHKGLFQPFTIEPLRGHEFVIWGEKLVKLLQDHGSGSTVQANISVRDEVGKEYNSKSVSLSVAQLRKSLPAQEQSTS